MLTVVPMRANSPLTGWPSMVSAIFCDEVAVGDGRDDARDLGGRADEVVDERVDRLGVLRPAAGRRGRATRARVMRPSRPMTRETRVELAGLPGVELEQLVDAGLQLADQVAAARAQAHGEVALRAPPSARR